jgi:hypothetical protein
MGALCTGVELQIFVLLSTVKRTWGLSVMCVIFLSDFNQIWGGGVSTGFHTSPHIKYHENSFSETRGDTCRDRVRQTDMTKLMGVFFAVYANAPAINGCMKGKLRKNVQLCMDLLLTICARTHYARALTEIERGSSRL